MVEKLRRKKLAWYDEAIGKVPRGLCTRSGRLSLPCRAAMGTDLLSPAICKLGSLWQGGSLLLEVAVANHSC